MGIKESIRIISELADEHGSGVLETLQYMKDNLADFEPDEVLAFRVFMSEGRRMFS